MKDLFLPSARFVILLATGLSMSGCDNGPGSCRVTVAGAGAEAAYDYCEDYLGTEFNVSVTQNDCSSKSGTYQSGACSTAGALGTCSVGTGSANDYQYIYTSAGGSAGAPAVSTETIESACGVAGGTFAAH